MFGVEIMKYESDPVEMFFVGVGILLGGFLGIPLGPLGVYFGGLIGMILLPLAYHALRWVFKSALNFFKGAGNDETQTDVRQPYSQNDRMSMGSTLGRRESNGSAQQKIEEGFKKGGSRRDSSTETGKRGGQHPGQSGNQ